MIRRVMWRATALLALSAAAFAQPTGGGREQALRRAIAKEFESRHPLSADPALGERVNRLAAPIAQAAGFELPAPVGISETRQAVFAVLLGGLLYVSAGVLERLDSDEDLSLLLAHLIAHAVARHGHREGLSGNSIPVIFMGGSYGACHRLSPASLPLSWRKYSEGWEQEADELAARYLALPAPDFAAVFEKLRTVLPLQKVPSLYRPYERR
jgi:predicted Zn-dependent protease